MPGSDWWWGVALPCTFNDNQCGSVSIFMRSPPKQLAVRWSAAFYANGYLDRQLCLCGLNACLCT
jgi:hypothetical protein